MKKYLLLATLPLLLGTYSFGQALDFHAVRATIDFSDTLRSWDGFGFNYVETFNDYHYSEGEGAQDYGGFNILSEKDKKEIIDLTFGENGLKVALVKMFLGPNHQQEPHGAFDHEWSTKSMRYFVSEGVRLAKNQGRDVQIITTLYGPPAFVTKQQENRGRDLDPNKKDILYTYMADWVKYLQDNNFPIKYLSPHNEGEGWLRWDVDGRSGKAGDGHDYNLHWPREQVVDFVKDMPKVLKSMGIEGVKVTCGETYSWDRFDSWGYARSLADDPQAIESLGLVTSHGFLNSGGFGQWNCRHTGEGNETIRAKRPDMHAWVTSTSWSKMDDHFAREIHSNIYTSEVNAIIPWAGINRPGTWGEYDPNPGAAFFVKPDSTYRVQPGFYYYKQFTQAGQPGMQVVQSYDMDSEIALTAFAEGESNNGNNFVLTNTGARDRKIEITLKGLKDDKIAYEIFRTSEKKHTQFDENERYECIGRIKSKDGKLVYDIPKKSVTTFMQVTN